jgi:hypothetical protein
MSMKNLFEAVFGWLAASRSETPVDVPSVIPEHERRLNELQKTGRMVFLP